MTKKTAISILSMAVLSLPNLVSAQEVGYRVESGSVVVDQLEHFSAWTQAQGTLEPVTNEVTGAFEGLRPRLWRRSTNALQSNVLERLRLNPPRRLTDSPPKGRGPIDPVEFTILDAVETGTLNSKPEVLKVFDDDVGTWWEPVFPQDRSADVIGTESFFTIDLGRVVLADRIVLKFVGEEIGDPFLLFDVFTSNGVNPVARPLGIVGESPEYRRVYTTVQPNKSEREIEIDLARFNGTRAEQKLRLVHFIKVVATGSAFERGRLVSQQQYEELRQVAPQDTGMVEYTKRLFSGSLTPVEKGVWERLQSNDQGPIRFWQRERPRLAEVQLWGEGDDIFQSVQKRCAQPSCISVTAKTPEGPITFIGSEFLDGDLATMFPLDLNPLAKIQGFMREVLVDLGSTFWVEGYRHTTIAANFGPWAIDFSDGSSEADGSLKWRRVFTGDGGGLGEPELTSLDFDPVSARFMRVEWLQGPSNNLGQDATISEIQLLGQGYQPEVSLQSRAIELEGSRNLLSIEWDADTPPGTSVSMQTRTGIELGQQFCFYKLLGGQSRPLIVGDSHCAIRGTAEAAALAAKFPKPGAGAKPDRIDTLAFLDETVFSPWSEAYADPAGSAITSPSPRPVLLVRATLKSDDPDVHATLKAVRIRFDLPVANRLLGSLTPTRIEALGVDQPFSLVVQLDTLQLGLDELLLLPPPGMKLLREPAPVLYAGTLEQLTGEGEDMSPLAQTVDLLLPGEGTAAGDSLHLSFPAILGASAPEAIRLEFSGRLFSSGGRLNAQLRNANTAGSSWQRVDQERNSLVLLAQPEQKELFRDLALVPPVFTPNGDGRNDQMQVSFTLLSVGVGTGVAVEVYDLSGRLVRRVAEQRDNSTGSYAIPWDGRDAAGALVPPGLYAVRIKLSGETEGSSVNRLEELRTVAVAY